MYHRSRQGPNGSYGFGGHEQLEEQNNAAEDELRDKVGLLKTLDKLFVHPKKLTLSKCKIISQSE